MKEEFVPYEIALALKKLGFNEPCLAYYEGFGKSNNFYINKIIDGAKNHTLVPLYQQAFRYFKDVHNLGNYLLPKKVNHKTKWKYQILFLRNVSSDHLPMQLEPSKLFESYEDAELECLKKLIEICKNKQI